MPSLDPADVPITTLDPAAAPPSAPASPASTDHTSPADPYPCLWENCDVVHTDPESLYNHLCNDHIGRKSTNNLCLTCKWKDCSTTCAKRDHITSHLRVHTPLKPHTCHICRKSFKRPQDLKKHEKIHTEEHHVAHRHSKAITIQDPARAASSRPSAPDGRPKPPPSSSDGSPATSGFLPTPSPELVAAEHLVQPLGVRESNVYLHGSRAGVDGWDRHAVPPTSTLGAKRTHDQAVGDLIFDMKRRRVVPTYDSHMADRLSSMGVSQHGFPVANSSQHHHSHPHAHHHHHHHTASNSASMGGAHGQHRAFSPRSVSLDIRSEEELAAVNEFLITLGRDVTNGIPQNKAGVQQLPQTTTPVDYSHAGYFDAHNLYEMGLSGMPGIPVVPSTSAPGSGSGSAYPGESSAGALSYPPVPQPRHSVRAFAHYTGSVNYGGSGASPSTVYSNSPHDYRSRPSSYAPAIRSASSVQSYTPLETSLPLTASSHLSPLYSHSPATTPTPSDGTPPPARLRADDMSLAPYQAFLSHTQHPSFDFDRISASRGLAAVPQLAPPEFMKNLLHPSVQLQVLPPTEARSLAAASIPKPVEPKLAPVNVIHPGPPAKLTPDSSTLYPSLSRFALVSGAPSNATTVPGVFNKDVKLPPLGEMYRSSSPSSSMSPRSSSSSASPRLSPEPGSRMLPGMDEGVLRGVSSLKIELERERERERRMDDDDASEYRHRSAEAEEVEERMRHAALIRELLVAINEGYRKRVTTHSSSNLSSPPLSTGDLTPRVTVSRMSSSPSHSPSPYPTAMLGVERSRTSLSPSPQPYRAIKREPSPGLRDVEMLGA